MTTLLQLVARILVRLYPPAFRRRFGTGLREDYQRLIREDATTWRGGFGVLRRMGRDAAGLPGLWRRARAARGGEGTGTRGGWLAGVAEDVRHGARGLLRDPAFSGVVVLVLGVGVALAAGVGAVLEAYLVRGLPFPEAERLVSVRPVSPVSWSDPELEGVLDPPISWDLDAFTLVDGDRPRMVRGQWVAPGFLEAFGVEPALGRGFRPDEAGDGGTSVMMLSHGLWRDRYGADPGIVGRTVRAYTSDRPEDAEVFTVVGVLPADFWFFNEYTEVLAPLRADNPVYMGRLAPGVTAERAAEVLTRLGRASTEAPPADFQVEVRRYQERYVERVRPTLGVLGSGVVLVLLIAWGNVTMLLLVRTGGRRKELAVRQALGAPRRRIARQLVAEGLLLAGLSTVLGLLLGGLLLEVARGGVEARLGVGVPGGPAALALGSRTVLVALLGTVGLGALLGLAPFLGGLPGEGGGVAREGGGSTGGRRRTVARNVVVGLEIGLSLTLLIGAGLSVRSALHLSRVDLGFEPENVTAGGITLRLGSYPEPADRLAFWERFLDEARSVPGVEAAGVAIRAPFLWSYNTVPVESEEAAGTPRERLPAAVAQVVSPGYLDAMSIPLVHGRSFDSSDGPDTEPVALVSESLAAALWPGRDPLGRRIRSAPEAGAEGGEDVPWLRVVGVVPDVWNSVELGPAPDYYLPLAQLPITSMTVVVRTLPGAGSPVPALEAILARLDPDVPLSSVTPLAEATAGALAPARFLAAVLVLFGAFAVLLAVLGLYGAVSYAAAQRSRDVAIRMALGADRGRVVRLFVTEAGVVVAVGLVLGIGGGLALGRALAGQLRGVAPDDPLTFGILAGLLGTSALAASWLPARRAARTDPSEVMRSE